MSSPTADQTQGAIDQQAQSQPPAPVMSCKNKDWIEFRLLDMEGNPVGGKKYIIKTSDDQTIQGVLPGTGKVRLEDLKPGTCTINFPELDAAAWERV